jgi:hypothetical protein
MALLRVRCAVWAGEKSNDSLPCKADIECQVILKTYELFVHVDVHYLSNLSWEGEKNVAKYLHPSLDCDLHFHYKNFCIICRKCFLLQMMYKIAVKNYNYI